MRGFQVKGDFLKAGL